MKDIIYKIKTKNLLKNMGAPIKGDIFPLA